MKGKVLSKLLVAAALLGAVVSCNGKRTTMYEARFEGRCDGAPCTVSTTMGGKVQFTVSHPAATCEGSGTISDSIITVKDATCKIETRNTRCYRLSVSRFHVKYREMDGDPAAFVALKVDVRRNRAFCGLRDNVVGLHFADLLKEI